MTPPETEYLLIPLTQGQWATVDVADYEWLMRWKWNAIWSKDMQSYYAVRRASRQESAGWPLDKQTPRVWMHRQILGLERGDKRKGDHVKSEETLNNRRSNLRIATSSQNSINSRLNRDSTTGLKGVSWHKKRLRYVSRIRVNGKVIHLGEFLEKERAHAAYCMAAIKYFGEFARAA